MTRGERANPIGGPSARLQLAENAIATRRHYLRIMHHA